MSFVAVPLALVLLQGPVTMRYRPPVGATYRYRFTMTMDQKMPGGKSMGFTQSFVQTTKILSRSGGKTRQSTTISNVDIVAPKGSPMAGMAPTMKKNLEGTQMESTVDESFRPVAGGMKSNKPGQTQMVQSMGGAMQNMTFPQGPVRVGTTWQSTIDFGKMMANFGAGGGSKPVPIKFRVSKIEKRGGKTLATVDMTMTNQMSLGQGSSMTMTVAGPTVIDVATGIAESTSSVTNSVISMGKSKIGGRTTTKLVRIP